MSFMIKQYSLLRESRLPRVFSVSFPDPAVLDGVREDAAVGMVACAASSANTAVRNDFDAIPIFQRPLVNATWDAASGRWTDIVEQGEEGFTLTPTLPYREVLYRCRPFWYRMDPLGDNAVGRVSVSPAPLVGYTLAPMFPNGKDFVYRPAFELGLGEDGLPHSRSGLMPVRANYLTLMEYARAYDSRARVESVKDWFSDMLLLLVEFATWNFSALMAGNKSAVTRTGYGMQGVIASSGNATASGPCVWRGKENPWLNTRSLLCDVLMKNANVDNKYETQIYHLPDMQYYNGVINEHYVKVGTSFPNVARGTLNVNGFSFNQGVLYPSTRVGTGQAIRSRAFIQSVNGDERMIAVGVNGSSENGMLPVSYDASPFFWEASQCGQSMESKFGARLVLDEKL